MMHRRIVIFELLALLLPAGCLDDPSPVLRDASAGGCLDAAVCMLDVYPCAPFGSTSCSVIADEGFVPANTYAEALAGDDGVLSLSDIFADKSVVGILLFGTAGWCPACRTEAHDLNRFYADFQDIDAEGHRLEFVTVVFQDTNFRPADREFAEAYDGNYHFGFPTVADPPGAVLDYFDPASAPGNILIDATTMQIHQVIQGYDEGRLVSAFGDLDGSLECR
jgi:thiol-disulfide isomerase/thioredoxin